MAQQTAVEWLKMKLEDENSQNEYINPLNPDKISFKYIMFLFDYALKMEKEQIKEAIELPSDEEIRMQTQFATNDFYWGAKWMKEQILNQNK
jgi:hypothetical protein